MTKVTAPKTDNAPDMSWQEAMKSAVESHRKGDLSEWELHLIGRRVDAEIDRLETAIEAITLESK